MRLIIFTILIFLLGFYNSKAQTKFPSWVSEVGARQFSIGKNVVMVKASGKIKDTTKYATQAIQAAIDQCAQQGGGVVKMNSGTYITGAIFIKSNVVLEVGSDVVLLGSQKFEDYPKMKSRIAGIEMEWPSALINIVDQKNCGIAGNGKVNARGKFCWDKYWAMRKDYDKRDLRWIVDYDVERVRTILVQNSQNVSLKDVHLSNAGFWTVHVLYSSYVTVDGIQIRNNEDGHGPSTDGIDIDSSTWVLVENCDIDCNDDNFCLKSGRDWDGLRVNKPTAYVVIRNSIARRGAGLLTLGSETSGGIKHVYAYDLKAAHTDNGFRIKSATTRGGTLEDIHISNWVIDTIKTLFQFNLNWYPAYSYAGIPKGYTEETMPAHWIVMLKKVDTIQGAPHVKGLYVDRVKATNSKLLFDVNGLPQSLIDSVSIQNSYMEGESFGTLTYYRNWDLSKNEILITAPKITIKQLSKEEKERLN